MCITYSLMYRLTVYVLEGKCTQIYTYFGCCILSVLGSRTYSVSFRLSCVFPRKCVFKSPFPHLGWLERRLVSVEAWFSDRVHAPHLPPVGQFLPQHDFSDAAVRVKHLRQRFEDQGRQEAKYRELKQNEFTLSSGSGSTLFTIFIVPLSKKWWNEKDFCFALFFFFMQRI